MKKSIIGIRFPKNNQGDELVALDLNDGTTLIRTSKQFNGDLQQSNLTMSINEAARNPHLLHISVSAITDGEVSGNATWNTIGSEFKATPEYCSAVKGMNNGIRKVKTDKGIVEKVPEIGDTVIRSKDGYHVESFLTIKPNAVFNDSLVGASMYAIARLQAFGNHSEPVETVSAVEAISAVK
jgi:hypothetical protein